MGDFPIGDPHCPDCHGTGRYQGLGPVEPCKTCEKKEGDNASLEDALEFGDLVESLFPGTTEDPDSFVEDPIQATLDAAPDLSDPKWDDDSELKTFPPVPSFEEMHQRWWEKVGKAQSDQLRLSMEKTYKTGVVLPDSSTPRVDDEKEEFTGFHMKSPITQVPGSLTIEDFKRAFSNFCKKYRLDKEWP